MLINIWYLVSLLGFLDFSGGNGSTSDSCLLVNSLGFLVIFLVFLFFFFISFYFFNIKKIDF